MLNTTTSALRNAAVTILTLAVGLAFISWGVGIMSVAPVIGGGLVVIGLAMFGYGLYTSGWFGGGGSMPDNSAELDTLFL